MYVERKSGKFISGCQTTGRHISKTLLHILKVVRNLILFVNVSYVSYYMTAELHKTAGDKQQSLLLKQDRMSIGICLWAYGDY
jgi:hypothetical protein